ncbi:MAG: adenylosuccinate synthase [Bacteroidales bacterium]|nr:adenylosuccinate synthase [Bacteroidales bacterium]
MKQLDIVLGLQWGDEGKGKIVDVLADNYPIIARFQGGPNAGHSIHFEGKKFVLRSIPSGIFRQNAVNLIGNGVVLDPVTFKEECEAIKAAGVPVEKRLLVSKKANLILPTHRLLDAAQEAAKGKSKIGSTLKGIGPTYTDKISRSGLRVGDILTENFKERYDALKNKHIAELKHLDFTFDLAENEKAWFDAIEYLKKMPLVDGEYFTNENLDNDNAILAEGAQGSMLDIDYGSYPFVTSSSTIGSGACIGLGIAPRRVGKVYGIFKAYCTRVGSGPFPTELFDATGEELRTKGYEFGAVTGRPRRTGWLDLVALKYAVMLSGVTNLIIMKADVMDSFDTVKVATGYKVNGKETKVVPFDPYAKVEPVYTEFPGWKDPLCDAKSEAELPVQFKNYIAFLEKELGVPISIISVGPDREQTIFR